MYACYVTHPEVLIDPGVPVPQWGLSARGRERASAFARSGVLDDIGRFVSSRETKALETARILAGVNGAEVESLAGFEENDRSSTGFVRPDAFEALADAFFADLERSVSGWETAASAQRRIVAAVEQVLSSHDLRQPIAFVGHGGVGTLFKCHLGRRSISRTEDQRRLGAPGGGNVFAFRLSDGRLLCDWQAMEDFVLPAAALLGTG